MQQLAIIGGGFMGGALAEGLLDAGWGRGRIVVAEISRTRREFIVDRLKLKAVEDSAQAVAESQVVVFAVKPQNIGNVLASVRSAFTPEKLAISVCAGVRIAALEEALGDVPVIRTMPNTPSAVGQGVTALCRGRFASDAHLATALNILSAVGKVVVVDESQMDAVTAVSGTGPAYVFYLAQALIEAAQDEGLSSEQAHMLVYQTLVGSAQLLVHDPAGPEELRLRVTSPGGTTNAAISHLEAADWTRTFKAAVASARKRASELGA